MCCVSAATPSFGRPGTPSSPVCVCVCVCVLCERKRKRESQRNSSVCMQQISKQYSIVMKRGVGHAVFSRSLIKERSAVIGNVAYAKSAW